MSDFRSILMSAGLRPREVVADGRWRRCATDDKPTKRNGAYRLDFDGLRGWWRNWATDDGLNYWASTTGAQFKPADEAKLKAQRERERAGRMQAIRSARAFWNGARPCSRLHPYLGDKGLSALGTAGLREAEGLLVIPVLWRGHVMSVQTIHPLGAKRFWPGAPVKAGCHVIDRPRAALTVLCEGLATGLAIYQAMRHARVVVAFDAGNLLPVVQELKPSGSVCIAADNDWGTQAKRGFNPGREKAANAAELIGAGVAWPEGIEGTDWADAAKEWGQFAGKRIEREIQAGARFVAGAIA